MITTVPVDNLGDAKKWVLAAAASLPAQWHTDNPVQWGCDPSLPKPQPGDDPDTAATKKAAIDADGAAARASIRALASEVLLLVVNPFLGEDDAELKWERAQEACAIFLDVKTFPL